MFTQWKNAYTTFVTTSREFCQTNNVFIALPRQVIIYSRWTDEPSRRPKYSGENTVALPHRKFSIENWRQSSFYQQHSSTDANFWQHKMPDIWFCGLCSRDCNFVRDELWETYPTKQKLLTVNEISADSQGYTSVSSKWTVRPVDRVSGTQKKEE